MEETNNNLYAKLNEVRLELSRDLNKTGRNTYSKYDYFQLKDFMPKAIEKCNEIGLFTKFWIGKEKVEMPTKRTKQTFYNKETGEPESIIETVEDSFQYIEYANLLVIDLESGEEELFKKETANVNVQGAQPIQNLGGKSTYMKRYMYTDVFEINENDMIEENAGKPIETETKIDRTPKAPIKKVATKAAPKVEAKPVEEKVVVKEEKPVGEAPKVEIKSGELMTMETKMLIAGKIRDAGLDPRNEILGFAKELGTDVPYLKESDKDLILEMLEKKVGGN